MITFYYEIAYALKNNRRNLSMFFIYKVNKGDFLSEINQRIIKIKNSLIVFSNG
ncbi:hypothetical protein D920_03030 [Enterococcus faecalis 13-SD-W-01]|nr:hypothetical protein D920_03030 [Enterococcus faecalis 13-SD-W-01]